MVRYREKYREKWREERREEEAESEPDEAVESHQIGEQQTEVARGEDE